MALLISSRSNPKIKQVRALRQRKARQDSGLFLVEGIHHIGEAAEAASVPGSRLIVDSVIYAPGLLSSQYALNLVAKLSAQGIPCFEVTTDVFGSLAEKENPQGILAVVRQPSFTLENLSPENFSWGVALVAPQDPGNTGTILRTIDAVGASGLLLLESSVDPYHPSAVRASMGTLFWYPVVSASFEDFAAWVRQHTYHVYGTSARGSLDYREAPAYQLPRILLMGSEREGLSAEQRAICELFIRLPMHGRGSSLNLGVATGVLLYRMLESDTPESSA